MQRRPTQPFMMAQQQQQRQQRQTERRALPTFMIPYAVLAILLLLQPTATVAIDPCPAAGGQPDCVLRGASVSGADLFNRLIAASTRNLTLSGVELTAWPPADELQANPRAQQLEGLSLEAVRVSDGGQVSVSGLQGLRRLRLVNCCPLEGTGVHSLPLLEELSLEETAAAGTTGCKIPELNASWLGNLPSLQNLTLRGVRVDALALARLDAPTRAALRHIRLVNNGLNLLGDAAFGQLPGLLSLTLEGNIVQYIRPGAFSGLPELRLLSVRLPREGQLAKIWEKRLEERFENNTKLETLHLVNARLAEDQIDEAFKPLRSLRHLDLSGNHFRRLHNKILASLTNLQTLDLSNGSLECLYNRNFGVMTGLRSLSLANNRIRVIGRRALLGLAELRRIDLAGNPLEIVQSGAFCRLRTELKDDIATSLNTSLSVNVSEPCPPGFNPTRIDLFSPQLCLLPADVAGSPPPLQSDEGPVTGGSQSRHTFLIIIGLCVAFLLITVISMMAYKGWSKRKNAQLARDEAKELELQAMVVAAENGEGGDGGDAGKKPQNGRHHHRHHQRPSHSGNEAGKTAKKSPSSTAEAASPTNKTKEAAKNSGSEIEIQAQVESPERGGGGNQPSVDAAESENRSPAVATEASTSAVRTEASAAEDQPQQSQQQQQQPRPGVTPMTTVPEDSDDLEARAITTLVVV